MRVVVPPLIPFPSLNLRPSLLPLQAPTLLVMAEVPVPLLLVLAAVAGATPMYGAPGEPTRLSPLWQLAHIA